MKLPALQFYPGDWLRDNVAGCSLAAQGLWLRMMIVMHDSDRYGYFSMNGTAIPDDTAARKTGCAGVEEYRVLLAELERFGVPSRSNDSILYSRRMVRDAADRAANADRQQRHRDRLKHNEVVTIMSRLYEGENEKEGREKGLFCPKTLRTEGFRLSWSKWVEYRSGLNKTPKCWKIFFQEQLDWLGEMGEKEALESISATLRNGWQGLFEPKKNGTAVKPKTDYTRGF